MDAFDIVILGDGPISCVTEMVKLIVDNRPGCPTRSTDAASQESDLCFGEP
jgi:hypothetical protein